MELRATGHYRGGWSIESAWDGKAWSHVAIRDGKRVEQGLMSYHRFLVCLDRIDGRPCLEDFIEGLQKGLTPVEAAVPVSTEEAWTRAKDQAQGITRPAPVPNAAIMPPLPPEPVFESVGMGMVQLSLFGEDWA